MRAPRVYARKMRADNDGARFDEFSDGVVMSMLMMILTRAARCARYAIMRIKKDSAAKRRI